MATLRILTIPDPLLKKVSVSVEDISPGIRRLAADLTETALANNCCIGVAAPQVGRNLRIIFVDVSLYPRPFPNHGRIILLNPVMTAKEGERFGREGCLSVPDLTGNVKRSEHIRVEGRDLRGKPVVIETSGFEAVVFQHEIDHLDGYLFLDRVSSLKTDVFRRKQK